MHSGMARLTPLLSSRRLDRSNNTPQNNTGHPGSLQAPIQCVAEPQMLFKRLCPIKAVLTCAQSLKVICMWPAVGAAVVACAGGV